MLFFENFSTFLKSKPKRALGIDIGSSSIKVAEVAYARGRKELVNYGIWEERMEASVKEGGAISTTSVLRMTDSGIAGILRDVIEEARMSTIRGAMSVSVSSSFFTVVNFPAMDQKEIEKSIPFQARQYIPIPLSEVVLDWKIMTRSSRPTSPAGENVSVLLIAVPKEVVAKYTRIAKLIDLELTALEVETFSLVRSSLRQSEGGVAAFLNIGARNVNISVVEGENIWVSHNFDIAGEMLTQAIARGLGIGRGRAEELKRESGIGALGGEQEVSQIIVPILDLIARELEKIFAAYKTQYGDVVKKLYLSGGTANMPGIIHYFVEKFGIETSITNPFHQVAYPLAMKGVMRELGPRLDAAVGLALRGL